MKSVNNDKFETSPLDEWTLQELDKYVREKNKETTPIQRKTKKNSKTNVNANNANFTILENYGALSTKSDPPIFTKVNWFGNIRYDIRRWEKQLTVPKKGIALTDEELQIFLAALDEFSIGNDIRFTYYGGKLNAKIYNNICVLSSYQDRNHVTWTKEVNIVDWGYGEKVDIRHWTDNYGKCGRGISLTEQEIEEFRILAEEKITDLKKEHNEIDDDSDYFKEDNKDDNEEIRAFLKTNLRLESLFTVLTSREAEVLEERYGLRGSTIKNLEELGCRFDVTSERIRQIEAKGLKKLKQELEHYIDNGRIDYVGFDYDYKDVFVEGDYYEKSKDRFIQIFLASVFHNNAENNDQMADLDRR